MFDKTNCFKHVLLRQNIRLPILMMKIRHLPMNPLGKEKDYVSNSVLEKIADALINQEPVLPLLLPPQVDEVDAFLIMLDHRIKITRRKASGSKATPIAKSAKADLVRESVTNCCRQNRCRF
ncbi:uncharacterized protein LOC112638418 [Camponotus floridanus]|uniref:uncharacterized protein LOC112638418 n=1 Tax=Camponotus floridanus TaxID=104421 RepID=UPI000DC66D2D|nr:uncharacterized protein LOC112638418 [Camponotus floridanus]